MDYDVSLHNLVVFVAVIPTSPRLSKTEFVCERYCVSIIQHVLDRRRDKEKKGAPGRPALGWVCRLPCRPSAISALGPRPTHVRAARLPCRPPVPSWLGLGRAIGRPPRLPPRLPVPRRPAQGRGRGRPPCGRGCLQRSLAGLAGLEASPRPGTRGGDFSPNGHFSGPAI